MSGLLFEAKPTTGLVASLARWSCVPGGADPAAFEAECVKLQEGGKMPDLNTKLRGALLARLASAKEADARNAFAVFLELMLQWKLLASQAEALAKELVAFGKTNKLPELTCALLLSLYSVAQEHATPTVRFSLLQTLVVFCAEMGNVATVLGPVDGRIERVQRWVDEWEMTTVQQQELWALVFDTHAEDAGVLYEAAIKCFTLHAGADLAKSPELRARIVKALVTTIRSPDLLRCDELSKLGVLTQLEKDATYAPLHKLLGIMARGTYGDFLAFADDAANRKFMEGNDLAVAACGDKIRLLTLVSLSQESKELKYADVATALRVDGADVETWVMQAIGHGLITAKMDQVREVIAVSLCADRDFGKTQWERLHTSLVDWRQSIHGLLHVVQQSRPTA